MNGIEWISGRPWDAMDLVHWFFDNDTAALKAVRASSGPLSALISQTAKSIECKPGAIINAASCALALVNRNGEIVLRTPQFAEAGIGDLLDMGEFEALNDSVSFAKMDVDKGARFVFLARSTVFQDVALPNTWRNAIKADDYLAILPFFRSENVLRYACYSAGLNDTQTKVVVASIRAGNAKAGAALAGISHQRARALISQALTVTGHTNFAGLVRRLATLSIGLLPNIVDFEDLVRSIWGLSERQVSLMALIATGVRRKEAAAALGISEAVAKKEMGVVYQTLGLETATDLSLFFSEHLLLSLLGGESVSIREVADLQSEPLSFVRRPDGSLIAISDYGPRSGKPVFYVHSSMTTRPVPKRLLAALCERGFRPISIDRPGFGLTATVPGGQFETAARDFEQVREALGLERPLAIARGGAQMLLALARLNPDALGGAVVINPDPRTPHSGARNGPLGMLKELFLSNPTVIAAIAKILSSRLTRRDVGNWLQKSVKGSAADEAVAESADVRDDYWRMVRGLATGSVEGYVAEQAAIATGHDEPLASCSWRWKFVIGSQDTLHDPVEVERYWSSLVPEANFQRVEEGGRLLAFSHVELLVEELAALIR